VSTTLEDSVKSTLSRWKEAFNSGNAARCSECYEVDAIMVAKPFGEFRGRLAIKEFWQGLIDDGFSDVSYQNAKVDVIDEKSLTLSAEWTMNKASGVITKELWVLQDDGTALLREDHFKAL